MKPNVNIFSSWKNLRVQECVWFKCTALIKFDHFLVVSQYVNITIFALISSPVEVKPFQYPYFFPFLIGSSFISVKCINNQYLYSLYSSDRSSKPKRKRSVEEEQTTCTICFEELKGDLKILSCQHKFHVGCIGRWFREQVNIMSFNLVHSNSKRFVQLVNANRHLHTILKFRMYLLLLHCTSLGLSQQVWIFCGMKLLCFGE